jgi:hypothetical protein
MDLVHLCRYSAHPPNPTKKKKRFFLSKLLVEPSQECIDWDTEKKKKNPNASDPRPHNPQPKNYYYKTNY